MTRSGQARAEVEAFALRSVDKADGPALESVPVGIEGAMQTRITVAFLLGVVVALTAALVVTAGRGLPEARAQSSGNNELLAMVGNGGQQQNRDTIFIIDSKSSRLAVYQLNNGRLSLLYVRNMLYDLKLEEYANDKAGTGKQSPGVGEIKEFVEKKKP